MRLIRKKAYARAGLVGNPSDGYFGKTLAMIVRNFSAEVTLYEWDQLEVVSSQEDHSRFDSLEELVRDVRLHGYYGGIRLVKATIKKFAEYCRRQGHALHDQNFAVRYQSNIPQAVGLAGSSAIIVATLRCLMEFYGVEIPRHVQPSLALSVETRRAGHRRRAAGPRGPGLRRAGLHGLRPRDDAGAPGPGLRRLRAAGSADCCRRCTWPIAQTRANRPRSFTTTCGTGSGKASRRWWTRWPASPT